MTRDELLNLIDEELLDNTSQQITPAILRNVLAQMLDSSVLPEDRPAVRDISLTDLYDALDEQGGTNQRLYTDQLYRTFSDTGAAVYIWAIGPHRLWPEAVSDGQLGTLDVTNGVFYPRAMAAPTVAPYDATRTYTAYTDYCTNDLQGEVRFFQAIAVVPLATPPNGASDNVYWQEVSPSVAGAAVVQIITDRQFVADAVDVQAGSGQAMVAGYSYLVPDGPDVNGSTVAVAVVAAGPHTLEPGGAVLDPHGALGITARGDYDPVGNVFTPVTNATVWGNITGSLANQTDLQAALDARELAANKNQNNGYAGLGANGAVPISRGGTGALTASAARTAMGAEASANRGVANGYAPLDANSLVPAGYLPSYVDDVIESATVAALPAMGEAGKIYVITSGADIDKQYRWSGSAYRQIVASPGSTDAITEGAINLYFTLARVLATALTGLTSTSGTVASTDTVLTLGGKVRWLQLNVIAALTGYARATGSGSALDLSSADGLLIALGKLEKVGTDNTVAITNLALLAITTERTAAYTLVLADAGQLVPVNTAGAITVTIPTHATAAFAIGTVIQVRQMGAGQVTIAGASGVTVNAYGGLKIPGQYGEVGLHKTATNTWIVTGGIA